MQIATNPDELIETLWNVNSNQQHRTLRWMRELIETLWNVNESKVNKKVCIVDELIETLWNVNLPIPHYQR